MKKLIPLLIIFMFSCENTVEPIIQPKIVVSGKIISIQGDIAVFQVLKISHSNDIEIGSYYSVIVGPEIKENDIVELIFTYAYNKDPYIKWIIKLK